MSRTLQPLAALVIARAGDPLVSTALLPHLITDGRS
jgi:hypothetical protein